MPPLLANATLVSPAGLIDCSSATLTEPAVVALPPNVATILCAPMLRADVLHTALVPLTGTALQPANAVPASVKATLPVGTAAVTVAVRVTIAPAFAGLAELESDVLLGALLTPCDNVALVELLFAASPE